MITLRPYQELCVNRALEFFRSERVQKPKIIVAPTAAGKSIIIAATAAQLPGNVLVLQPSLELLQQNFAKYCIYDTNAAVYSASAGQKKLGKATFCTIGTIVNVKEFFKQFTALIIDECHSYPSRVESQFGQFLAENPQLKILGLTATPYRLHSSQSGAKLVMLHNSNIYNGYQHIIQIQDIARQFWAPLEYIEEDHDERVLRVNTTGAEYTEHSLDLFGMSVNAKVLEAVRYYGDQNRPTLVFVPSVAQAASLSRQLPGCAYVCATTPKKERADLMRDFRLGRINTVFNVNILGIGFDYPELSVIVDACPTLSLARHYQKIGRLTRPHASKSVGTVVDLSGNTARFGKVENIEMRKIGTTYHIFSGDKQLSGVNFGEVHIPSKAPVPVLEFQDMTLTFGKNKGKKISECEAWYLSWVMDNVAWNPELVAHVKLFLQQPKKVVAELF